MGNNTWTEYSQLVLKTQEDHKELLQKILEKQNQQDIEIAMLKVKSGMWGAIGGLIPLVIGFIIYLFEKKQDIKIPAGYISMQAGYIFTLFIR